MRAVIAAASGLVLLAPSASANDNPVELAQVFAPRQVAPQPSAPQNSSQQSPVVPGPARRVPSQQEQPQQLPSHDAPAQSWTTTFSTETRFYSWRNNFVPPDTSGIGA